MSLHRSRHFTFCSCWRYWCGDRGTESLVHCAILVFEMLNCLEERAMAAAAVAIFSPTLSCSIDRETTVSRWKWERHPQIRDTFFFPPDQSLWSSDSMLTIKLSTSSPVVILLALPIIFFITFCDVLFLFSICKDYPKLHVWTEHGNQMRALAM